MRFEEILNKDLQIITINLVDTIPQTAANYGMFFTTDAPCEVMNIIEKHGTAGTDGSPVTLQIEKLTGTTAKGSGTNLLLTAFNLKGTAYTYQEGTLDHTLTNGICPAQLKIGDSLALKKSGTLTALADLQVTIYIKRIGKGDYRI